QVPAGEAAGEVHLEEPVLGAGVAEAVEAVLELVREDVGHAARVADDVDGRARAAAGRAGAATAAAAAAAPRSGALPVAVAAAAEEDGPDQDQMKAKSAHRTSVVARTQCKQRTS